MASRGRGRGRGRDDYGVSRIGPITEEQAAYPPNPKLEKIDTQLEVDQQCLVALNRILINYWKFKSPFQVEEKPERPPVRTFSQTAAADPERQKEAILKFSSPAFFPEELLKENYIPPARRRGPRLVQPKRTAETNGEAVVPSSELEEQDGAPADEPDDFGGDDYAHDHYADEDNDEMDDGGGDDDGIF